MKKNRYAGSASDYGRMRQAEGKNLEDYEQMKNELNQYQQRGIILRLGNKKTSSERIASICCIRESGSYMGDYVLDDENRLVEICFHRVRN